MGGKGEDGDGVHQHPQAARVATVARKAAVTVGPGGILGEQCLVKLQEKHVYGTMINILLKSLG